MLTVSTSKLTYPDGIIKPSNTGVSPVGPITLNITNKCVYIGSQKYPVVSLNKFTTVPNGMFGRHNGKLVVAYEYSWYTLNTITFKFIPSTKTPSDIDGWVPGTYYPSQLVGISIEHGDTSEFVIVDSEPIEVTIPHTLDVPCSITATNFATGARTVETVYPVAGDVYSVKAESTYTQSGEVGQRCVQQDWAKTAPSVPLGDDATPVYTGRFQTTNFTGETTKTATRAEFEANPAILDSALAELYTNYTLDSGLEGYTVGAHDHKLLVNPSLKLEYAVPPSGGGTAITAPVPPSPPLLQFNVTITSDAPLNTSQFIAFTEFHGVDGTPSVALRTGTQTFSSNENSSTNVWTLTLPEVVRYRGSNYNLLSSPTQSVTLHNDGGGYITPTMLFNYEKQVVEPGDPEP